jgi:hypothetical protein
VRHHLSQVPVQDHICALRVIVCRDFNALNYRADDLRGFGFGKLILQQPTKLADLSFKKCRDVRMGLDLHLVSDYGHLICKI